MASRLARDLAVPLILLVSAVSIEALMTVSQRLVLLGYESRCVSGIQCGGELALLSSQGAGLWLLLFAGFAPTAGFVYLVLKARKAT